MTTCLEQEAISHANMAVKFDQTGDHNMAIFHYLAAVERLNAARQTSSTLVGLDSQVIEYSKRAEELQLKVRQMENLQSESKRAKQLALEATEKDKCGEEKLALDLYTEAAELFLKLHSQSKNEELQKMALNCIERAERLKSVKTENETTPKPPPASAFSAETKVKLPGPLGFSLRETSPSRNAGGSTSGGGGGGDGGRGGGLPVGYTKEEMVVLKRTSCINGRMYVPFMPEDYKEKFDYVLPFTDKDGVLSLSLNQKSNFSKWVRASELSSDPKMIVNMSCFNIRQTIVSDCSYVASLAISAQYEKKFNKKLISNIIYPQNKRGEPVLSTSGKYMVKLHINGVVRKIVIDDFLPVGKDGQLLCSFSSNRNELWVSLMEKAYMKVMGGYDFPGSNSNIDLHALTGWIPERVSMSSKVTTFNADREFCKIMERFHQGHCLVTVATGQLSEDEGKRAGLAPSHAYAVLDVQEVMGKRLFQLKNPWSHMRWKGNFSEMDVTNWNEELKKRLNYSPESAASNDDGIFWIDYDSLRHFFDVIYINWNPDIFKYTSCLHQTWSSKEGPKKDSYNMGENPQYKLEVNCGNKEEGVWLLLTRHITDKDDFAKNKEFITLLVYKTNGKRVYYPSDPPPYKDGVKINSPHYLCTMKVGPGRQTFTLVVSQYEKNNTIDYTIRVYSTSSFKLSPLVQPYVEKYEKEVTDEWKGKTAGGCRNHDSFSNNPVFHLKIDNKLTTNNLLVELKAPKSYNVGFEVVRITDNVPSNAASSSSSQIERKTGDYRRGFCCLELENMHGGVYSIQPSTYFPGQEGPFILGVSSSCQVSLKRVS